MTIALWIIGGILLLFVVPTLMISHRIFTVLLVRETPEKWTRTNSMPDDEESCRLFKEAMAWHDRWQDCCSEVTTRSDDGLKLAGLYFDFGADRAVVIAAGRTESCLYSCHYGEPYRRAGFNVLVIDNRAHGESEGKYNYLGFREYRDLISWARMLHDERGVRGVWLHGVCIGCSSSLFAATAEDCPEYIRGVTVDGMYQRFFDTCFNHMKVQKRPLYPFAHEIMFWIHVKYGVSVMKEGPITHVGRMRKPILFLHSREDLFSTPEKLQEMYDLCPSEQKKLVWFDRGAHSRVRINNTERYDRTIIDYLGEHFAA